MMSGFVPQPNLRLSRLMWVAWVALFYNKLIKQRVVYVNIIQNNA